jgi:putative tryptophan/tyrosine transport system substrate-binding protein
MRRRDFISLAYGTAIGVAARPVCAVADGPVIGFMSGRSPEDSDYLVAAFRQGLAEVGLSEGKNVVIEYRWARGRYDQLPALAADLVKRKVAVLVGVGGDVSALAAKRATATIPVIFGMGSDPVKAGLVESISRPGGNATGFTLLTNEMGSKRLGLLHDLLPKATFFGVLVNPKFPPGARALEDLQDAARKANEQLFVANASNDAELDASFASLRQQHVSALLVNPDPYFDTRRERIIAFAAQERLPAVYQFREYALAGGLISYGPSVPEGYRQAGIYTGRVLNGEKPADLPVVQPTKFEFVINLKTAKTLGLMLPSGMLSFADEVIE